MWSGYGARCEWVGRVGELTAEDDDGEICEKRQKEERKRNKMNEEKEQRNHIKISFRNITYSNTTTTLILVGSSGSNSAMRTHFSVWWWKLCVGWGEGEDLEGSSETPHTTRELSRRLKKKQLEKMEMKSWDFKENSKNVSFARRRRCRVRNEPVRGGEWSVRSL